MARPRKKPDYDSDKMTKQFIEAITDSYLHPAQGEEAPDDSEHKQLKLVAEEFSITPLKVRKLLITSGAYEMPISREVNRLHREGKSLTEIQEATGLKRASVHSYLPYSKVVYKMEDATVTAERIRKYRIRKELVEKLKNVMEVGDTEKIKNRLWEVLLEFQGYPFCTAKGLRFYYTVKGDDLFFTRKTKSVTRATVNMTLEKALELQRQGIRISGPKKLGTFGASYLFAIFQRVGIIDVAEK